MLVLLMGRIYGLQRWDDFRCHDIQTKFRKDWFRHSKVDWVRIHIQTQSKVIS
jgi:hypothetical protein